MRRLGYKRYVSQGGDWGAVVSDVMARQAPAGLLGIHVNMPATVPPDVAKVWNGCPLQEGLRLCPHDGDAPANLGYSLADSPAGLAAGFYDKSRLWRSGTGRVSSEEKVAFDVRRLDV
jgi:hypothetical protein